MRLGRGRRRWGAESRRVVRARRAVYHGRGGKRGDSRTSHHADQPVTDREQDRQSAGYREEHERRAGDDIDSVEGGGHGARAWVNVVPTSGEAEGDGDSLGDGEGDGDVGVASRVKVAQGFGCTLAQSL